MFTHNSHGRMRSLILVHVVLALAVLAPIDALGQQDADWKRASQLYDAQNFVDALPLLEKVAVSQPDNPVVLSKLGFSLYAVAGIEKDQARRKKLLDRAREVLLRSQSFGDDSNLTKITLDGLSGSGDTIPYSQVRAADTAIRDGEAAFVKGDLDGALKAYKRALDLDPKLYDAAVYAGDVEFKKAYISKDPDFKREHLEQAGVWFAKAISIEANRETAYRYWGDALDLAGKSDEARDKFVEAIVAEPFNQKGYMGLSQWANRHRVAIGHPRIVVPANASSGKLGEITVSVDEQLMDKAGAQWLTYGITRATWMPNKNGLSEKFTRAYPGESEYRHSLAEEVEALKITAESAALQLKDKKVPSLDPSLVNLIKLNEAGLLEPYVLFVRVDKDIARDYAPYRSSHRDKLRKYWLEIVIPKD